MAAALTLGGVSLSQPAQAAKVPVTVLDSPEDAAAAIRSDDGTQTGIQIFGKKDKKQQHQDAIESRILIRTTEALTETAQARVVYYYADGGYYILVYKDKTEADRAEKTLSSVYGADQVIRDRVIWQDDIQKSAVTSRKAEDDGEEEEQPFDGIHLMGMDTLKEDAKNWSGSVKVAVIDSGIDRDHKLLENRIDTTDSVNLADGADASKYDDTYGHGSHVSGIITQATPNQVKIMAVRVFDDYQMSSLSQITMGIDYAREHGADVMNMSLGHTSPTEKERDLISAAMQRSVKEGCTLVAASGNENKDVSTSCPANNSWTISVGSLTPDAMQDGNYVRSWFSNYGKRLDFIAPGQNITSAWADGTEVTISGTSMATPHMAAAAAYVKLKHADYDQWEVYKTFQDYAVDLGTPGKDDDFGYGYVDLKDYASEQAADQTAPKYQAISAEAVTKKTMNDVGKSFSLNAKVEIGNGKLSYRSSDPKVASVANGKITVRGTGKCEISITASKTDTYKETTRTVQVEVVKGTQTLVIPTMKYTKALGEKGFYLKASVKKPGDGKVTFLSNDDSVVSVKSNGYVTIKGTGTAKVYAVASSTKSFQIQYSNAIEIRVVKKPAKAKISRVASGKKALRPYWKKQSGVSGYQIRYSTKSSMKSAKTKTISGASKTSYRITKLGSKKKYYIQVRAYKKYGTTTIYGNWSSVKKQKTK